MVTSDLACPRNMHGAGRHHFSADGQCVLCGLNPLDVARKLPVALTKALTDLLTWMPTPAALDELPERKRQREGSASTSTTFAPPGASSTT